MSYAKNSAAGGLAPWRKNKKELVLISLRLKNQKLFYCNSFSFGNVSTLLKVSVGYGLYQS
jgi:hypothetical protein